MTLPDVARLEDRPRFVAEKLLILLSIVDVSPVESQLLIWFVKFELSELSSTKGGLLPSDPANRYCPLLFWLIMFSTVWSPCCAICWTFVKFVGEFWSWVCMAVTSWLPTSEICERALFIRVMVLETVPILVW